MNDNQPTLVLRTRLPLRHSYTNRKRSAEDALVDLMSPLNDTAMLTSDCSNSSCSGSKRSSPSNNNNNNNEEEEEGEEELRPSAFKAKHSAFSFSTPTRHNNNNMQLVGSSSMHSNGKFNSAFSSSVSVDHLSSPVTPSCSAQMLHLSLNSPQPYSQKRVPLKVLTNSGGKRGETPPPTKLFAFSPLVLLSKQPCCSIESEEKEASAENSVKDSFSCCSTDMSTEDSMLKPRRLCMNGRSSLVSTNFTKEHVTPLVSNRRRPKSVTDEEVKQSTAYLPNLTRTEGSISLLEAFDCEFDSKGFDVHFTPEDDFFLSSPSKITSLSPSKVMKRTHEHYPSEYQKPLNDVPINEYGSSCINSTFGRSESVTSSITCYSHNSLVDFSSREDTTSAVSFAAGNKVAQE